VVSPQLRLTGHELVDERQRLCVGLRHLDDGGVKEEEKREKWEEDVELSGGTRSGEDGHSAWDIASVVPWS
jgi:hypothetical protein